MKRMLKRYHHSGSSTELMRTLSSSVYFMKSYNIVDMETFLQEREKEKERGRRRERYGEGERDGEREKEGEMERE